MSDTVTLLAADIQERVGTLFTKPDDKEALDRLHQDAQQLTGSLVPGSNQALQNAVTKELQRLEEAGHLPAVTISESGQIESSKNLLPPTPGQSSDQQPKETTLREVTADSTEETTVSDLRVPSKGQTSWPLHINADVAASRRN
jgi:hypothetical protein